MRKPHFLTIILLISTVKTDDNPDGNFSNFEKSTDICKKCECLTFSDDFVLKCSNRDLRHTLSNWPDHKNKSLRAWFSNNVITTLEKFPASNSTVFLALDHCGIKFLAPGLFENMKNVQSVDLSHNLITIEELSAEKFKGPFSNNENEPIELTHLNLAYNEIHSLPQSLFEHTPRLKYLNLEGNGFKVLDLQTQAALSSAPSLESLNLANNGMDDLPDTIFMDLKAIVGLDLSKNHLRFVPIALKKAAKLEVLVLNSNPIYELFEAFNGMPNMIELSLNNLSNLVEIHGQTFTPLQKLKKLHICDNSALEVFESDAFSDDGNFTLDEFYLNNNNLIDIPYVLLDWSSLKIFEFNDNNMTCTCNLYNITKKLPANITKNKGGPYCMGEGREGLQVFSLTEEVCNEDYGPSSSLKTNYRARFSIIRVSLITTSLIAIFAIFLGIVLYFTKEKKYGFLHQGHFARSTSVLYNPLNRQPSIQ